MTSLSYVNSNLSDVPATGLAGSLASGFDGEEEEELEPLAGNLTGAVAGVC